MSKSLPPTIPYKVAHVLLNFEVGGLENLVAMLVPELVGDGLDCRIFCLNDVDDSYHRATVSRLRNAGVSVTLLKKRPGIDLSLILRLRKLLKGIDVVHSHNISAHVYGCLAAKLAGVPAILMTRHDVRLGRRSRIRLRLLQPMTDVIICVAERVVNTLIKRGIRKTKLCVVPNGLDLRLYDIPRRKRRKAKKRISRILGLPDDVGLIGTVGRLAVEKGFPTLLDAFRDIRDERDDVCLLIIGDGPMRADLERYVSSHNMQRRVFFLGMRKRPALWISILDVLVQPSYYEALPMVLLEAFAARVPVLATDVGGMGEIIEDGKNGVLVRPRDASGLKLALCSLLESRDKREHIGRGGLATVTKHYSIERIARMHEDIYSGLVDRSGPPRTD
jgi:glycosyltransferase involved in cell wall biosynthesis